MRKLKHDLLARIAESCVLHFSSVKKHDNLKKTSHLQILCAKCSSHTIEKVEKPNVYCCWWAALHTWGVQTHPQYRLNLNLQIIPECAKNCMITKLNIANSKYHIHQNLIKKQMLKCSDCPTKQTTIVTSGELFLNSFCSHTHTLSHNSRRAAFL